MMRTKEYIQFRLTGKSFDGNHSIPFGFLKCMTSFQDMATALARSTYIEAHSDNKPPRGFMNGVGLSLANLADGNAVVAKVQITTDDHASEEAEHYFNRGCEALTDILAMDEYDVLRMDEVPAAVLSKLRSLGRGLQSNDSMEITGESLPAPIRLNRESRLLQKDRQFVSASELPRALSDQAMRLSVSGQVATVDRLTMDFTMQLTDGRIAKAPLADHAPDVFRAIREYELGTQLQVDGMGQTSRRRPHVTFTQIDNVEIVWAEDIYMARMPDSPPRFGTTMTGRRREGTINPPIIGDSTHTGIQERLNTTSQLDELRSLEDGWLDGEGKAPSEEGLEWLVQSFDRYYPADLPRPYLFPTEQGGVQAEWVFGEVNIEVRFDLLTKQATYLWIDADTEVEHTLDLTSEAEWRTLSTIVRASFERAKER